MIDPTSTPSSLISGERFSVAYRLAGDATEAQQKARDICIEQTIEFPGDLVPPGIIRDHIFGRIESFEPHGDGGYRAVISYAAEITAYELTQLLNVVFGNISIKPGIRVEKIELPPSLLRHFKGPAFGRDGIRKVLGVAEGPMLFTALKPMGLSSGELAGLAYRFAIGGIDIIKDDHGLTNQAFSPFEERVSLCAEAVRRANRETGKNCIYVANITSKNSEIIKRARFSRDAGAGGLMLAPALVGLDLMREIADDDSLPLPIFSHPAFQGSFVTSMNGISHGVIFGQIARLAGADATIYPNFGGRFSFTRDECREISLGTSVPMGHIKPIFPAPGGGMSLEKVPEMMETYGKDVIFLIGGDLFRHGPDLVESCRYFREIVDRFKG